MARQGSPSKVVNKNRKHRAKIGRSRKLAAIMFTDIVGYTGLTQSNEERALALLEKHNRILRPFFANHRGREIKTIGDSFLVEFDNALDAVKCAVKIQEYLKDYNTPREDNSKISLRIGIHLGDVVHRGSDIFGDAVNIASRIYSLADPGGVSITAQVYHQVHNKLHCSFRPVEHDPLKHVSFPVEVFAVIPESTSLERSKSSKTADVANRDSGFRRVAVLPFANISADPKDEYLADGMTEELISGLALVSELTVIARTSVMRYKGTKKPIDEIGRELQVGAILEGSLRRAGDRLRITAQLIEPQSQGHLWTESYNRQMLDIFEVQEEIARQVVSAAKMKLLPKEGHLIEGRRTESIEAYNHYLKGRYYWNERTPESLEKSIVYFEKAIENDPKYALAYTGIADAHSILCDFGILDPKIGLPRAREAARKALEHDETLAEAHTSLAAVYYHDWDFDSCARELRRSIELKPGYSTTHHWYAIYLQSQGRVDEAIRETKLAREIDPFSPQINTLVGIVYLLARQYEKAIVELREALKKFPEFFNIHSTLGMALIKTNEFEEGLSELKLAKSLSRDNYLLDADLAIGYALTGDHERAIQTLSFLEELSKKKYVSPVVFASLHASLGNKEAAFDYLERAVDSRSADVPHIVDDNLLLDTLGDDPRFSRLLRRIGIRDS